MIKLNFDSCFLIDLERERKKKVFGPAHIFLKKYSESYLSISLVALGEFAVGFSNRSHPILKTVLERFELLHFSEDSALEYSEIFNELRGNGITIGSNDIWIAAASRVEAIPLVTKNARDFSKISNLHLVEY